MIGGNFSCTLFFCLFPTSFQIVPAVWRKTRALPENTPGGTEEEVGFPFYPTRRWRRSALKVGGRFLNDVASLPTIQVQRPSGACRLDSLFGVSLNQGVLGDARKPSGTLWGEGDVASVLMPRDFWSVLRRVRNGSTSEPFGHGAGFRRVVELRVRRSQTSGRLPGDSVEEDVTSPYRTKPLWYGLGPMVRCLKLLDTPISTRR